MDPNIPAQPTQTAPIIRQQSGMSESTKTMITVLLLVFAFPIGIIFMWIWMRNWPTWAKVAITLPFAIAVILIVISGIIVFGIKPAGQFPKVNNANTSQTSLIRPSDSQVPIPADNKVAIDAETDRAKRQQKLSARLDLELSHIGYTPITGTMYELKIPSSYTIPTKINSQTPSDSTILAVTDKESDLYWQVWQCDYEYNRMPSVKKTMGESFCKDLLSKYTQEQLDSYQNLKTRHNFFIDQINTSMYAKEWVLDNVIYEGVKLRNQPEQVSRGTNQTINGMPFLAINVACCGGYEMNYFIEYSDSSNVNNPRILKFGTNDIDGAIEGEDRNIVLDKILSTMRSARP